MEEEFSKIENILKEEANKIQPAQTSLKKILERADNLTVTKKLEEGYKYQTSNKGRINNSKIHWFMKINWNIAVPVVVILILAGVLIFGQGPKQVAENNGPVFDETAYEVSAPAATGKVDDAAAMLLTSAENEFLIAQREAEELALAELSDATLNDFGAIYNEIGL